MIEGEMFSREGTLPSLPVPPLQQTMEKYLQVLEPITSASDLKDTVKIVKEFAKPGGVGEFLQSKLQEKAEQSENWFAEWWENYNFYSDRNSVVINSNPAAIYEPQTFYSDVDQFRFTAKLIHSVLKFKDLVDLRTLPVDMMGKDPSKLHQYTRLFSGCRQPLPKLDRSVSASRNESRHVVVAHNNHFYSLPVYKTGTETPLSEEELMQQLSYIVNATPEKSPYPVGVLSAEGRNQWAQAYKVLKRDSRNRQSIEKIEKSICLICLDHDNDYAEENTEGYEVNICSAAMQQMLHGGGSHENSMNRWFDKSVQFIVNRNGFNGMCYEHSSADGLPVVALASFVMGNLEFEHDYTNTVHTVSKSLPPPDPLSWNVDYSMLDRIELAKQAIDDAAFNLELCFFRFNEFGKNVPKKYKCSPDAFIQVVLQLAYWRVHFHHASTEESASIRKFAKGRTECIRSATTAATRFAREMDRDNHSHAEKRDLFMQAVQAHVQYTVDALEFQAIDCHMLGLKFTAEENEIPLPEIFQDKCFGYAMHFQLVTSQVPSKFPVCPCFGPHVLDGYGFCYNPMEKEIVYSISAFRSHPKTQAKDLGEAMAKALNDVHLLLAISSNL